MRRFGLPSLAFVLAMALVTARLYDVQVTEHEVWATEAANLVRSYRVEPYVRGAIRDREGRVMARDEEVYELEFVWREFRRGHPLGQVAMAWSLLAGAPVPLSDARGALASWALGLVALTPRDLEDFASGEALSMPGGPAIPTARDELLLASGLTPGAGEAPSLRSAAQEVRRRSRAEDLVYYLHRLLDLSQREERTVRELVDGGRLDGASYLELAATATGVGVAQVESALVGRCEQALSQLGRLAREMAWEGVAPPDGITPAEFDRAVPAARLVALVEARRAEVEDETADALFELATGFPAWRFDQRNLARLELGWIDRLVGWDAARRHDWVLGRGAEWPAMVQGWLAGHVIARSKLAMREAAAAGAAADPADVLLSALAHAFRTGSERWARTNPVAEDWRRIDDLEGLASLPDVLARGDSLARSDLAGALPFQSAPHRASSARGSDLLREVLAAELSVVAEVVAPADAAEFLVELVSSPRQDWNEVDRAAVAGLLEALELGVQRRITALLDRAGEADRAVEIRSESIGRASETRRYVVRDRGTRPKVVGREPGYELVHLVTRHPREFAGFRVRPTTRRTRPEGIDGGSNHHADGVEVASHLIGRVRHPFLVDLLRQRPSEVELAAMQRKLSLPEEDREQILDLIEASWQPDERMGGSGLEGWLDRELRGREGYSETQGLQDRKQHNRAPIHRPAIDGADVHLTLDLAMQRAAEAWLRAPAIPDDSEADRAWFEHPVGAVVLASTDGEILVAASTPLVKGLPAQRDTDGERVHAIDRTLRRPKAEPPGSIVKPLFAAYALERLGLGFEEGTVVCSVDIPREGSDPKPSPRAGFGKVDCNRTLGHSRLFGSPNQHRMTMDEALTVSCNTYFAALGERHYDGPHMRAALEMFGLGRPTGVRFDPAGRGGLVENWAFGDERAFPPGGGPEKAWWRQFIANGLTYLNVNVVQMARAYAALATGRLPEMRLVREAGGERLEPRSVPLPIAEHNLARVRKAMAAVVSHPEGSGHGKGLSPADLGFAIAGKTGSADYGAIPPREGPNGEMVPGYMRKHAWFACFFPVEAPRFVAVVYMHDTAETASHGATYLTSQFLRLPEVQAFLTSEGVR